MANNIDALLNEPIVAVNVGLKKFAENLEIQEVEVIHIQWTPPAGGDKEMVDILDNLL